uniref:50S ribosomal protein L9, chloroplastic n=1 Tax=Rhodogorgon sp. TaxID=2485824 RepID=A0A3G3MHT4_9FLOR|nr:ribosomal protein L9 [Rhodogorgon sp.]
MKKTFQIIVKQEDTPLGKIGEIKTVKLGYASNYLIPNGIAEIASEGKIAHYNMLQEKRLEQTKYIYNKALNLQKYLEIISKISIRKKVGKHQQIFGRLTEKEIAEKLIEITGKQLQKKQIVIPEIKKLGLYRITIKLTEQIDTTLILNLLSNNF